VQQTSILVAVGTAGCGNETLAPTQMGTDGDILD